MNEIIRFRISKQTKKQFVEYCKKNNINISDVIRNFIENSIKDMEYEKMKNKLLKQTSK